MLFKKQSEQLGILCNDRLYSMNSPGNLDQPEVFILLERRVLGSDGDAANRNEAPL